MKRRGLSQILITQACFEPLLVRTLLLSCHSAPTSGGFRVSNRCNNRLQPSQQVYTRRLLGYRKSIKPTYQDPSISICHFCFPLASFLTCVIGVAFVNNGKIFYSSQDQWRIKSSSISPYKNSTFFPCPLQNIWGYRYS